MIGLNLAGIPVQNMASTGFDARMPGGDLRPASAWWRRHTSGMTQRLLILAGLDPRERGLRDPHPTARDGRIDFSGIATPLGFGTPKFAAPVFDAAGHAAIAPVAIIRWRRTRPPSRR